MKFKKSHLAGLLFGVAMTILFRMLLGTPGLIVLALFTILGMQMFQHLDDDEQ